MKKLFKNANVRLAASGVLLIAGFWPVHRSEDATIALGLAAFVVGMGVFIALNLRDERAKRKHPPRSH
jgi:hypothetical protein